MCVCVLSFSQRLRATGDTGERERGEERERGTILTASSRYSCCVCVCGYEKEREATLSSRNKGTGERERRRIERHHCHSVFTQRRILVRGERARERSEREK